MGVHVLVDDVNEFAPQWNIQRNKEDEDEATASEHTLATNVAIEEGQLLEEVTHHIPSRVVLSYVHITTMFFNILPYKEKNFYSSKYFFFRSSEWMLQMKIVPHTMVTSAATRSNPKANLLASAKKASIPQIKGPVLLWLNFPLAFQLFLPLTFLLIQ